MALKKSTPLNLAALRQDYSMLPKIAAVKAQSSQQLFNAITSGLEKRKERIQKKELGEAATKMLEPLLDRPMAKRLYGDLNAEEIRKLIGDDRKVIQLADSIYKAEQAEAETQRKIELEQLEILKDKEYLKGLEEQRDARERQFESTELLNRGVQSVLRGEGIPEDILSSGKLTARDLDQLLKTQKELTPAQVKAVKEGGFEVLYVGNKVHGYRALPKEGETLTAFQKDQQYRLQKYNEIADLLEKGDEAMAIRLFNSIPDLKLPGDEDPTAENIALYVQAGIETESESDEDKDDKNSDDFSGYKIK
jgi:hypothetical protein